MRIVAFVVEVSSLRRLLGGVGVGPREAEPLSRAPPGPVLRPLADGSPMDETVEG